MKKILLLTISTILTLLFSFNAFAGEASIQFKDLKVKRDKTFNVVLKVKSDNVSLDTADISFSYDPNMMEYIETENAVAENGIVKVTGKGIGNLSRTLEYQVKFKAISAGKTICSVVSQEVKDREGNLVVIKHEGKAEINITPANSQSKNAFLKSLDFSPGEIDREFNSTELIYNTEVNADIDSLAINYEKEDKDATVTIEGNENFATGSNKVTIVVTAPDGKTVKRYEINVTKLDSGITGGASAIANGQRIVANKYTVTVMAKPESVSLPPGYKKLTRQDGAISSEVFCLESIPENETPNVYLVYGINQDNVEGFFRVDESDTTLTIQKYISENLVNSEDINNLNNYKEITFNAYPEVLNKNNLLVKVIIGLSIFIIILVITLIIIVSKNNSQDNNRNNYRYDDYDDFDDDDDDDSYFTKNKSYNNDRNYKNNKKYYDDYEDDAYSNLNNDKNYEDDIEDLG